MQVNEEDKGLVPSATILRINEQARRLPPVLGEFAVQERAQLFERIAEQAREIERLRLNIAEYNEHERCYQSEIAALKSRLNQPASGGNQRQVEAKASDTSINCWSCKLSVSLDDRADADGNCPHCRVELDLEEYLRAALSANRPAPGFVLAPLEPTEAMRIASYVSGVPWSTRAQIYRDMVAALLDTTS